MMTPFRLYTTGNENQMPAPEQQNLFQEMAKLVALFDRLSTTGHKVRAELLYAIVSMTNMATMLDVVITKGNGAVMQSCRTIHAREMTPQATALEISRLRHDITKITNIS